MFGRTQTDLPTDAPTALTGDVRLWMSGAITLSLVATFAIPLQVISPYGTYMTLGVLGGSAVFTLGMSALLYSRKPIHNATDAERSWCYGCITGVLAVGLLQAGVVWWTAPVFVDIGQQVLTTPPSLAPLQRAASGLAGVTLLACSLLAYVTTAVAPAE